MINDSEAKILKLLFICMPWGNAAERTSLTDNPSTIWPRALYKSASEINETISRLKKSIQTGIADAQKKINSMNLSIADGFASKRTAIMLREQENRLDELIIRLAVLGMNH